MTTWIGPLKPAPNASASRSYALRWVVSVAEFPSSGVPIRMPSAGVAMAHNATRPTTA